MLKYNHAIVLTMFLVALFVLGLAWWCYRDCVRVVGAEAQHIELQQREEECKARTADGGGGGNGK